MLMLSWLQTLASEVSGTFELQISFFEGCLEHRF